MIVRRGLLRVFWRQALPATLFGIVGLGAYSLLSSDVMTSRDLWPALVIFVQCLWLAWSLGRFTSPAFAFLTTRGYSRGTIWANMMLATGASIVLACLPAAIILWSGARSYLREQVAFDPYFPLMADYEMHLPFVWLALAVLLAAAFHYAWIRRAQPTRGAASGSYLCVAILLTLFTVFNTVTDFQGLFVWLSSASYVAIVLCLVFGSRALYRTLEVQA